MSKGYSGLFLGTKGERIYKGSSKQMQSHITSWARDTVEHLNKISKRQREKFNTATVVYDESTGKYYNGRNHGIEIDHEEKNTVLFGDNIHPGLLPKESLNRLSLGNCAEMHAVNKALNDGADLKNLKLYTIHTTKRDFGKPKEACENCTFTLRGKIKENYTGWKDGKK